MRRLTLLLTFAFVTSTTLVSVFLLLFTLHTPRPSPQVLAAADENLNLLKTPKSGIKIYASLPPNFSSVSGTPIGEDARAEILRQYLTEYDSPLGPFAPALVTAADQYNLDFRLLAAIAQQESNLCKKIPPDSYNCWGWGIHSRGTLKFSSFEEAIFAVSQGLREDYLDQGYATPEDIMAKYTPLSNGSWAAGIRQFLTDMEWPQY